VAATATPPQWQAAAGCPLGAAQPRQLPQRAGASRARCHHEPRHRAARRPSHHHPGSHARPRPPGLPRLSLAESTCERVWAVSIHTNSPMCGKCLVDRDSMTATTGCARNTSVRPIPAAQYHSCSDATFEAYAVLCTSSNQKHVLSWLQSLRASQKQTSGRACYTPRRQPAPMRPLHAGTGPASLQAAPTARPPGVLRRAGHTSIRRRMR